MGITATLQDLPIPLTATLLHPWPILRALEKQHSVLHCFFPPMYHWCNALVHLAREGGYHYTL